MNAAAKPRVELWAPERRGDYWAAAMRIHFPDGDLDIIARASSRLAAKYLAKVHGMVALKARAKMPAERRFVGADPGVGNIWDDIGKGLSKITRSPLFKGAMRAASGAIPYVGPLIAASGVTDLAIDAAGAAVDRATRGKGKKRKKARARIQKVQAAAAAPNAPMAAIKARTVLVQAAKIHQAQGPTGVFHFRGLGKAAGLVRRVNAGDEQAEERLRELVAAAVAGKEAAIQALAYVEAARLALEEADEDYELEDADEAELEEVGARQARALGDSDLIRRLRAYRNWTKGFRPPRRREAA